MGKNIRDRSALPPGRTRILAVIGAAFFLGGLAGVFFVRLSGATDSASMSCYLTDYLSLVQEGEIDFSVWTLLVELLQTFFLLILLSASIFGIVGLPLVCLERGFVLSFASACFVRVFGLVGILPAFILFGLPALLWAPALFLAASAGWTGGYGSTSRESRLNASFLHRFFVCLLLMILCALLEWLVVPVLLSGAAGVVLR